MFEFGAAAAKAGQVCPVSNPFLLMAEESEQENDGSMFSVLRSQHLIFTKQAHHPGRFGNSCGNFAQRGFTLIELMVVVAIVGIIMAMAVPSYNTYLIRANTSAAKAVLLEAASREEQYIVQNRDYFLTTTTNDLSGLGVTIPADVLRAYSFDITAPATSATNAALASMPTYQATATPVAGSIQAGQSTLSINQFGLKMPVLEW